MSIQNLPYVPMVLQNIYLNRSFLYTRYARVIDDHLALPGGYKKTVVTLFFKSLVSFLNYNNNVIRCTYI